MTTPAPGGAAAALYPSAGDGRPAPSAPSAGQPSVSPAAGLYPSASDGRPDTPASAQSPAPRPDATQQAPQPGQPPAAARPDPATALYDEDVPTAGFVNWREPAGDVMDVARAIDPTLLPRDAPGRAVEGEAARQTLAKALYAAGAGPTVARELWGMAVQANRGGYSKVSEADSLSALRGAWGAGFDANMALVRGAVAEAAKRDPSIIRYLNETGLGNDPRLIRTIHARLTRRPK